MDAPTSPVADHDWVPEVRARYEQAALDRVDLMDWLDVAIEERDQARARADALATTLDDLARHADQALGWLNRLAAVLPADVFQDAMPNNFSRQQLAAAIARAYATQAA